MRLILHKRMFLAGAYREPGEYPISGAISLTDAKCAAADGYGSIVQDAPKQKSDAPENKQFNTTPENKGSSIDPNAMEDGGSGGAGSESDGNGGGENPLLAGADTGGGGKRRGSKTAKR